MADFYFYAAEAFNLGLFLGIEPFVGRIAHFVKIIKRY